MQKIAEKFGMTPSGLYMIIALAIIIPLAYFLLPDKRPKQMNFKEYDTAEMEKLKQKDKIKDEKQPQAAAAAAPAAAPMKAATPDVDDSGFIQISAPVSVPGGLDSRIRRIDPFAPVDQQIDVEEPEIEVPDQDYGGLPAGFPITGPFKLHARPDFHLSAIATNDDGVDFVIINGEILKQGQSVFDTNYKVISIDTDKLREVILADPLDPENTEIKLRISHYQSRLTDTPPGKGLPVPAGASAYSDDGLFSPDIEPGPLPRPDFGPAKKKDNIP